VDVEICDISFSGTHAGINAANFAEHYNSKNFQGGLIFESSYDQKIPNEYKIQISEGNSENPIEKTASQVSTFIREYKKNGLAALNYSFFKVSSIPNFYLGIVRPRAIRFLVSAYLLSENEKVDPGLIHIHSNPAPGKDYKENMLQQTTLGTANILGGTNTIHFDLGSDKPVNFSKRISRNIGNLLREESKMVFEEDPVAGSYFLDLLTHQYCKAVWGKIEI
jgi:hypothetical protein